MHGDPGIAHPVHFPRYPQPPPPPENLGQFPLDIFFSQFASLPVGLLVKTRKKLNS